MFNPIVIRMLTVFDRIGMVIESNSTDDVYFQIYAAPSNESKTALVYSMPWGSQIKAIEDFETWVLCAERGHPRPNKFSYAAPSPDWRK